jgi:hypothetical protein
MKEPIDAFEEMTKAVEASKRGSTVQFPVAFARSSVVRPPLARMLVGGRGGEVRLKLYMTLAMQATRPPRTVRPRTNSYYARLLNLDETRGAKRVATAMKWLDDNRFITRQPVAGSAAQVTVLSPDGSGSDWGRVEGPRWITVPLEIWKDGWIFQLSGRGIACYVALRDLNGGSTHPLGEYMDNTRKRSYGLSDDTWTRASKELREIGLLETNVQRWGDDARNPRLRTRYLLTTIAGGAGKPSWS